MIIDRTYFWGDLRLPFSPDDVGTSALLVSEERAEFDLYLAAKEDEFLGYIFGDLKDDYVAGRGASPWSAVDALVVNSTTKTSIIANYVYFYFWNSKQYGVDDSGTYVKSRESGTVVPNSRKTEEAWNQMIKNVVPLLKYLSENWDTFVTDGKDFSNATWSLFVDSIDGDEWTGHYLNHYGL